MADTQSIIALNIGSQRISMGVFTTAKNNLVLKSYRATSILADPATEAARIPQVQLAIKELAKSLKLGSQKAAYALAGQSVFIRFVKLPPLEDEGMDELVEVFSGDGDQRRCVRPVGRKVRQSSGTSYPHALGTHRPQQQEESQEYEDGLLTY